MGLGDFSGYVETQPKALMADLSAEEWLEQVFQHSGRYWGARIGDAEFELTSSGKGRDLDRRTLRSMSKSIAEQAQGEIWFVTKEGEGTTFFVKLPILRPAT